MTGCHKTTLSFKTWKSPGAVWTHWIVHRRVLCFKSCNTRNGEVLGRAKNVVNYKKGTCKRQGCLQSSVKKWALNTSSLFSTNQDGCLRKSFCCASLNSEMIVTSKNDQRHRNAHMFLNCDFNTPLAFLGDVADKMNLL